MEITQIEHFVTVTTAGSYGRASAELNVTQSALSKSVKRLESYLSSPLFERTTRGVRLTPSGEALLPYCQEILNERRRAIAVVTAVTGKTSGNVKIGVSRHLSDGMLPHVINTVLTENPRLSIEVEAGYIAELKQKLSNANLDVVLATCSPTEIGQHLAFEKLRNNDSIAVTRAVQGGKSPMPSPAEIERRRWIISAMPRTIASFQRRVEASGHADRAPPVVTNSAALTRVLLLTGNFVTICSRASIEPELASGVLVELDLPLRGGFPPLGILTRKKGLKSPAVLAVIQGFRHAIRGL